MSRINFTLQTEIHSYCLYVLAPDYAQHNLSYGNMEPSLELYRHGITP